MYVLINNGQVKTYPYSIDLLRKDNPQTSFPEIPSDERLAEWSVYPVQPTDQPEIDHTKNLSEGTPVNQGGWKQVWVVTDASAQEISQRTEEQKSNVRSERDQKLVESDWVVIKSMETDVPELDAWKSYRQTLRNIPQQSGFPWSVEWPEKP
jgi:hypothetical protein